MDWFGRARAAGVQLLRSTGDVTRGLTSGEFAVIKGIDYVLANQAADGAPVAFLFPEDDAGSGYESGSAPLLRAAVDLRSFRGNICEYGMTVGTYELWVQTEKTNLIPEGETVNLRVERGCLLDAGARGNSDAPVGWPD